MATQITEEEYNDGKKFPFIYITVADAESTARDGGFTTFVWCNEVGERIYYKVD